MAAAVPRLYDLCKRVLQTNVASLNDVGDVPYHFLRDVLPGCRVDQLRDIEELSPQIADEDEEIWELFFKRDFPLVAEARGLSTTDANSLGRGQAHAQARERIQAATPAAADLFTSFRELYYDEQVRREERLATAGTRLKERIASLTQRKQERRTILDPKLGFSQKRRRGIAGVALSGATLKGGRRVGPIPKLHWSQREYRPKGLADKARQRAGNIAASFASPLPLASVSSGSAVAGPSVYTAPRATRAAVQAVKYAVESSRAEGASSTAAPPRRPDYREAVIEGEEEDEAAVKERRSRARGQPKFIERRIAIPVKSSAERPYRAGSASGEQRQLVGRSSGSGGGSRAAAAATSATSDRSMAESSAASPASTSSDMSSVPVQSPPRVIKSIPGIKRKPIPLKSDSSGQPPASALTSTDSTMPAMSPPANAALYADLRQRPSPASSPPLSAAAGSMSLVDSLPMLNTASMPTAVKRAKPSLFIVPRKRSKPV